MVAARFARMKTLLTAALVFGWSLGAITAQARAQAPGNFLTQALHDCTFTRPCNWSSHALIAFGGTYALHKLGVPKEAAAGAAALLFVGKEVRDHLKWRVLGSPDSNGDMISGCAGALLAYFVLQRSDRAVMRGIMIDVRERNWLTITLAAP